MDVILRSPTYTNDFQLVGNQFFPTGFEMEVLVSMVHSVVCLPLCMLALWDVGWLSRFNGQDLRLETVEAFWFLTTEQTRRCIEWSAAYFAWELCHEVRNAWIAKTPPKYDNLMHAAMSFTAYWLLGFYFGIGHVALCVALSCEASTPFYNLYRAATDRYYYYLHSENDQEAEKWERWRSMTRVAFAVAFTVVRVVWQPIFFWFMIVPFIQAGWHIPTPLTHCGFGICPPAAPIALLEFSISILLNLNWFCLIVTTAKKNKSSN